MKRKIKIFFKKSFWIWIGFYRIVWRKKSYLHTSGWVESTKRSYPCYPDGEEIPWMNFTVVALLEERLHKDLRMFEFGSGYSTLFYARRVQSVVSLEYNQDWFEMVSNMVLDNAKIVYCPQDVDGEYCRAIAREQESFHIVVVDGRDRENCIRQAIDCLTEDGVILFDDSDRPEYQAAHALAQESGFRALSFRGIKPGGFETDQTTLFYKDGNCLGI